MKLNFFRNEERAVQWALLFMERTLNAELYRMTPERAYVHCRAERSIMKDKITDLITVRDERAKRGPLI